MVYDIILYCTGNWITQLYHTLQFVTTSAFFNIYFYVCDYVAYYVYDAVHDSIDSIVSPVCFIMSVSQYCISFIHHSHSWLIGHTKHWLLQYCVHIHHWAFFLHWEMSVISLTGLYWCSIWSLYSENMHKHMCTCKHALKQYGCMLMKRHLRL